MSFNPMPEAAEARETRRPTINASAETRFSSSHPDYNEDSNLGDTARIDRELANLPTMKTENAALDSSVLKTALEAERAGADALKKKKIYGTLDGVSGDKAPKVKEDDPDEANRAGLLANRMTTAELANELSRLADDADAETTRAALAAAVEAANNAVLEHKADRSDLKQMSTTVDVLRVIENADGTFDVPYAHAGDGRIYSYSAEDGSLFQATADNNGGELMVERGMLTSAERDLILSTNLKGSEKLPEKLRKHYKMASALTSAVGGPKELFKVSSGVIKGLKNGDKVLMFTDGIIDNMAEERIIEILAAGGGMKEIADEAAANAASGNVENKPDDVTGTLIELGGGNDEKSDQKRAHSGTQLKAVKVEDTERQKAADAAEIERIRKELDAAADVTGDAMPVDEAVELSDADLKDDEEDEDSQRKTIPVPPPKKKGPLDALRNLFK